MRTMIPVFTFTLMLKLFPKNANLSSLCPFIKGLLTLYCHQKSNPRDVITFKMTPITLSNLIFHSFQKLSSIPALLYWQFPTWAPGFHVFAYAVPGTLLLPTHTLYLLKAFFFFFRKPSLNTLTSKISFSDNISH